jgi:hypothetical protein
MAKRRLISVEIMTMIWQAGGPSRMDLAQDEEGRSAGQSLANSISQKEMNNNLSKKT